LSWLRRRPIIYPPAPTDASPSPGPNRRPYQCPNFTLLSLIVTYVVLIVFIGCQAFGLSFSFCPSSFPSFREDKIPSSQASFFPVSSIVHRSSKDLWSFLSDSLFLNPLPSLSFLSPCSWQFYCPLLLSFLSDPGCSFFYVLLVADCTVVSPIFLFLLLPSPVFEESASAPPSCEVNCSVFFSVLLSFSPDMLILGFRFFPCCRSIFRKHISSAFFF